MTKDTDSTLKVVSLKPEENEGKAKMRKKMNDILDAGGILCAVGVTSEFGIEVVSNIGDNVTHTLLSLGAEAAKDMAVQEIMEWV